MGVVGDRSGRVLAAIWDYFEVSRTRPGRGAGRRRMPGARWFPGRGSTTPSTCCALPGLADDDAGRARLLAEPRPDHADRGRAARPGPPGSGRAATARCRRGRPGRRVRAEHPGDVRADARDGEPRRDLLLLRAGVRHPHGGRPVAPDRADGAGRGRRLPVRRQADRPRRRRWPRSGPRCRRCGTSSNSPTSMPGRAPTALGGAGGRDRRAADVRAGRRSTTRSTCCTPPARPACRSRSCTATAASCWSTSRCWRCTTTSARATGSSGSPPPAG